jgi:hypothetical protein
MWFMYQESLELKSVTKMMVSSALISHEMHAIQVSLICLEFSFVIAHLTNVLAYDVPLKAGVTGDDEQMLIKARPLIRQVRMIVRQSYRGS